jgi:hypothetical protein
MTDENDDIDIRKNRFRSTVKSEHNPFLTRPGTASNVVKLDREGGMILADNRRLNEYDGR